MLTADELQSLVADYALKYEADNLSEELRQLEAEIREYGKDAERYRAIRANDINRPLAVFKTEADYDSWADALIRNAKGGE